MVLDEDGLVEYHTSGKNLSTSEIIKILKGIEGIVLISTDRSKIPKKIVEISSKLNVGIYHPDKDIPIKKKKKFYEDETLKTKLDNIHEIDAYIAAYFALMDIKDIIRKARKVSKDDKEYIELLKVSLRNRKIEPVSAKILMEEKEERKDKIMKKKIKKGKMRMDREIIDIKVENRENHDIKYYKEILERYSKKYLKLLNNYDKLSEILIGKIKDDQKIVPKVSFLVKKKIEFDRVFIDSFSEDVWNYLIKQKPKVYIKEEDIDKIPKMFKEKYIVLEYID
ncbi:DUF460 domain-containing protein, partial [Nanoarchaeota archaeon NZ13-N]